VHPIPGVGFVALRSALRGVDAEVGLAAVIVDLHDFVKLPEQKFRLVGRMILRRDCVRAASQLLILLGWAIVGVNPQTVGVPSAAELAAIAERGRLLAEYDQAAWRATDAVQMANPKTVEGQHYLARKENGKWTVVFGALNADKSKFLIGYEATEAAKEKQFPVKHDDPAREVGGFFLFAARALELALADFGRAAQPYNVAVLPAKPGNAGDPEGLFVYL
jgi:hypothetical protein